MHDFGGLTKVESDVSAFYTNEFLPKPWLVGQRLEALRRLLPVLPRSAEMADAWRVDRHTVRCRPASNGRQRPLWLGIHVEEGRGLDPQWRTTRSLSKRCRSPVVSQWLTVKLAPLQALKGNGQCDHVTLCRLGLMPSIARMLTRWPLSIARMRPTIRCLKAPSQGARLFARC